MSSLPSKEGVERVKQAIRDYKFLAKKEADLRKAAAEIPKLQEEIRGLHSTIVKELEGMDVKADGNFGWENRILWFLCEFDRQSSADPS